MKFQKKEGPVLSLEEYDAFFHSRNSLDLTVVQLNQIIHLHGFSKVRSNKMNVMEALEPLDLTIPARSTLAESGGSVSCLAQLTLEQAKSDFADIGWEECPVGWIVSTVLPPPEDEAANAKALVVCTSSSSSSSAPKKRKSRGGASGGGTGGRGKGKGKPVGRPPRRPLLLSVAPLPLLTNA